MKSKCNLAALSATLIAGWAILSAPTAVMGQQITRPRNPTASTFRPTFSPYLNLLRADTGVLPNYQQFVRPEQLLLNSIQRQDREIRQTQQAVRSVDRRIDSFRSQGSVAPTGVRGEFLNYSHFFPSMNSNASSRR
jgi:hypothetical protein